MPTYEYIQSAVNRTPRPRSERLRKLGGVIVSTDFAVAASSSSGGISDHTHANLDSLDQITVSDGYVYLTSYVDDDTTVTTKAKAGYADKALTNNDGYTLDWFIPVTENGVKMLKLNPVYNGLFAEGFISGGGTSEQGSGGGIDLDRVWESLTNNTDKPNVQINVAHIPDLAMSKITGLADAIAAAGSVKSLTVGTNNYTPSASGVITIPAYPTSLPASDVYAWAKSSTKPGYDLFEIAGANDVKAIEALTGTGLLKRTGTDVWTLDTNTYLTAVPKASDSAIGGFQTGYSENGKYYAVKMSGNKAYVNVPWTDTVYSLPLAASGTRGGIQIGYSENGKYYAVKLSSEKAYVYVPWTDTVYTHPTGGANTTISTANGKVLSAITVDSLGHVSSVSSKTLGTTDIPDLSGIYLPLTGGTLTGDLRLKNSTNFGMHLYFGDGSFTYLYEDTDDHLAIYSRLGVSLTTGSSSHGFVIGTSGSNVPLTVYGKFTLAGIMSPAADAQYDLGTTEYCWRYLYAKRWYPDYANANGVYIDFNTSTNAVTVHGNLIATGALVGGQNGSGSVGNLEISGHMIPTSTGRYNLGSNSAKWGAVYAGYIGDEDAPVYDVYVDDLSVFNEATVQDLTIEGFLQEPALTISENIASYLAGDSGSTSSSLNIASLYSNISDIVNGKYRKLYIGQYTLQITGYRDYNGQYSVYAGRYWFEQTSAASNNWYIHRL